MIKIFRHALIHRCSTFHSLFLLSVPRSAFGSKECRWCCLKDITPFSSDNIAFDNIAFDNIAFDNIACALAFL